ncbi:MAG: hypothetical protein DWQ05_10935 [Calditrichaeota bacterium]|nr:MAG: hypothetical protein DWQ05_10935 [Calditrichota bacterium]
MRIFSFYFLTLFLYIFLLGCDDDNFIENTPDLAKINVDLQAGFEDHFVSVKFNDERYFSADLTELAPLAGPLATFVTYLKPGEYNCEIFWQENVRQVGQPFFLDSTIITIGNLDEYYLGIRAYSDTISVELKESPFSYL